MATQFLAQGDAEFPVRGAGKQVHCEKGSLKVLTIRLRAGQSIPPCAMDYDVAFVTLAGQGTLTMDRETFTLKPGVEVVVPKEAESRSMTATENLVVLAVQGRTPPPAR